MVERRLLKNFDFALLLVTLAIIVYSCIAIYSASRGGNSGTGYVEKQIMFALIGTVVAILFASIHPSIWERHATKLYIFNLLMLIAVMAVGDSSKGAQRWVGFGAFRLQPSEFAKILMIVCLAVFIIKRQSKLAELGVFIKSFIYLSAPLLLIFKQPDLGTSLVLLAIWITMVSVMGTHWKNVVLFVIGVVLMGLVVWHVPGLMKVYQKQRLVSFIDPAADPQGSGYHVIQSRIAIGSGKIFGKGYLKGTQGKGKFIPEQHTDFIFTVVGEEFGFVGAVVLLVLYFLLIWRALLIMAATEDALGKAIAAGIVGMFLFHVFVNMGMTLGIMPVTGVPLPMFSYGGSSLMSNLMAIGMLEGISMRRHRISF